MARRLLFVVQEALFFTTHRQPVGRAMQDRGWEVHVAGPADPVAAARIEAAGFRFHPIPLDRGGQNPLKELRLTAALFLLLLRLRPRLVHYVSIKPVLWGGLVSRLLAGHGVVHAITGLGSLFRGAGARAGLRTTLVKTLYRIALGNPRSIAIFQNGDDLAVFRDGHMLDERRWAMIRGCGVDTVQFSPRPDDTVDAGQPPVVMFPARLIADKGLREFVGAAQRLRDAGVAARFVLVGRPDPLNPSSVGTEELAAWVKAGLVEHWGYSDDMPATLARAHIVVMPSFYGEGVPRGLIEAAAMGRAIVTADSPGCREIVRDGENGLLVPVRDAEATAVAIRRLLEDAGLRRRLGAQGRAMVESGFSVGHFVSESIEVYRRSLNALGEAL